jgi:hypothetical protein
MGMFVEINPVIHYFLHQTQLSMDQKTVTWLHNRIHQHIATASKKPSQMMDSYRRIQLCLAILACPDDHHVCHCCRKVYECGQGPALRFHSDTYPQCCMSYISSEGYAHCCSMGCYFELRDRSGGQAQCMKAMNANISTK